MPRKEKKRKNPKKKRSQRLPKITPPPPTEITSVSKPYIPEPKPDGKQQIKQLVNKEIPEGLVDQIIELGLVPTDPTTEGFSVEFLNSLPILQRYLPSLKTIERCQWEVRPIFKEEGDIKSIDVLSADEKRAVEELLHRIEGDDQDQFMAELKREVDDVAWEFEGKLNWTLKGEVAWGYFQSLREPGADYSWLNLPLSQNHFLNTATCVHPPNTYHALLWEYIDLTHGLLIPSADMYRKKGRYLAKLNLEPEDWVPLYGTHDVQEYLRIAKEEFIDRGAPTSLFKAVLCYYRREMAKDWQPKQEKLSLHFFLIAHLLQNEHPGLFRSYQKEVRSFIHDLLGKRGSLLDKQRRAVAPLKGRDKTQQLRTELKVHRFKQALNTDIFLAAVLYSYLFDGAKHLKMRRAKHRPPKRVIGRIIVQVVDRLAENPFFYGKIKTGGKTMGDLGYWERCSGEVAGAVGFKRYAELGRLLYALTGDRKLLAYTVWKHPEPTDPSEQPSTETNLRTPIKNLYHYWKPKFSKRWRSKKASRKAKPS